jgi:outer membrane receptor protein involved in Fe transport
VAEALDRLLAGAPCRYELVDSRTVRIFAIDPAQEAEAARAVPHASPVVSEVVVTASKRPTTLDRLPAGVSAIPGEQIAATNAVDVGRTIGQVAGVLSTNLGPGRDKLLIRGLSDGAFTGRTRSTVSTYLDDAPLNSNAPDPDLRLSDVERIEVVRGPQGALYGSGSLAGVYRIVTRRPELDRASAGASVDFATTKGGDTSHAYDAYANIPIVEGRAALRLVAYEERQGGYIDNVNLRIANVDETRRDGGRLAVRVRLGDNWRLDGTLATQHLRSNDSQYVTVDAPNVPPGGPDAAADMGQRVNQVREAHKNHFSYGGLTLEGDLGWGTLTSSLSYVHHVFSSQYDASAVLREGQDQVFSSDEEDVGVYTEAARTEMLVEDLVLRSSGVGRFDWLVGVYAARTVERSPSSLGILSAGPVVSTAYDERRKDRFNDLALYGEASYDLLGGWVAKIGGRLSRTRVHTTADIMVIPPYGSRFFDEARTFRGFSPKISLQREFANGDLVYALFSEGDRPGGFNSSGFFGIKDNRTTFRPDRLRNYEVGVKLRRLQGRVGLRAAAYYDDWVNIQTDQYRPSGLAYTANVADARIVGLEAEMSLAFSGGLTVQVNGLVSDSDVRDHNPDFAAHITGDLPGVPKASGGIVAVYEHPLPGDLVLRLMGDASYVGREALSFDASLPPRMGGYLRARLSAEVASARWRLGAYVTNPLDEAGDTFAYGNPFSFSIGKVRQVTPQRPRTVGVRLAAAF